MMQALARGVVTVAVCTLASGPGRGGDSRTSTGGPGVEVATGQPPVASAVEEAKAELSVEAVGTHWTGATGRPRVESTRQRSVGESAVFYFIVPASSRDLCDVAGVPARPDGSPSLLWTVRLTVTSIQGPSVRLTADLERANGDPETAWRALAQSRSLTLREGEHHILDFVSGHLDDGGECASLLLRVSAKPVPAKPPGILAYEVWLSEDRGTGREQVQQAAFLAAEGETVPFRFRPLRSRLAPADDRSELSFAVEISGSIRATANPDASLSLSLDTTRLARWGPHWVRGSGTKTFTLHPGEAVAVAIPNPGGLMAQELPAGPSATTLAAGVTRAGNRFSVNLSEYFAHGSLRIVVVARPER